MTFIRKKLNERFGFKLNAIVGAGLVPALCRVGKQNNKRAKCNLPPVYFYFKKKKRKIVYFCLPVEHNNLHNLILPI